MTAEFTEREVLSAVQAVARAHGVPCAEAEVLAAGSNVLVHLKPAPVVARVYTGTSVLHGDIEQWLAREVAVGTFLGNRGLAVPPTEAMSPGPHQRGGFSMTFWTFAGDGVAAALPDARELGRALRDMHTALADFPGELAPLSGVRDGIDRLLAELRPSSGLTQRDVDSLHADVHRLTPTVFESSLPIQALHGDASIGNLLSTDTGLLWNDLEDVCAGPVAWDVSSLVTDFTARGLGAAFTKDFLDAYGWAEPGELGDFVAAHELYTTIWQAFVAQRRPQARGSAAASAVSAPPY